MLNLLKNGEVVRQVNPGEPVKIDLVTLSSAKAGWVQEYDENRYELKEAIVPPPEPVDLYAYAADARWRAETGGINVGNVPIYTDDRSKLLISGMRNSAYKNPAYTTQFVTSAGDIVTLDAEQVTIISDAVSAHVSDVFKKYALVIQRLKNGSITAAHEIETIFFG